MREQIGFSDAEAVGDAADFVERPGVVLKVKSALLSQVPLRIRIDQAFGTGERHLTDGGGPHGNGVGVPCRRLTATPRLGLAGEPDGFGLPRGQRRRGRSGRKPHD